METNLRMALERGELDIHYQPIIDVQSNRVIGCEALLRWTHPEKGAISPSEFIPLAEATGQIAALTEYVLNRACAAATKWPWEIVLSVNISPVLLKHADFSANLLSVLYKSGLPAHRLELEITETALVENSRQANFMLREFQRLGLRLALDDFGTGFSSLSYLLTYSFDRIKIDRSFVADIGKSRQASAIILSIVNLARTLGIEPVAEGVESEDQLDYVKNVGCSNVQGYYFAKPMPEKNMLAFIEAHRLGTDPKENMTKTARG
jgi:EAL domain-containing protein (putative c-di-GMP-specific phosphodiesterase class I)